MSSTLGGFGSTSSSSSDGSILAFGAFYSQTCGYDSGAIQIFAYKNTINEWEQVGNSINGWDSGIEFGNFYVYRLMALN